MRNVNNRPSSRVDRCKNWIFHPLTDGEFSSSFFYRCILTEYCVWRRRFFYCGLIHCLFMQRKRKNKDKSVSVSVAAASFIDRLCSVQCSRDCLAPPLRWYVRDLADASPTFNCVLLVFFLFSSCSAYFPSPLFSVCLGLSNPFTDSHLVPIFFFFFPPIFLTNGGRASFPIVVWPTAISRNEKKKQPTNYRHFILHFFLISLDFLFVAMWQGIVFLFSCFKLLSLE